MKLTVLTIFAASFAGSLFGVGTVLVVWMKRTHRFMKRLANAQAARRRALAVGADGLPELPDAVWSFSGQHGTAGVLFRRPFAALVWGALVRILANPVL